MDGNRTYSFTPQKRGDTFRVHISVLVWVNVFKDGKVYWENVKFTEEWVARFTVEST